MKNSSSIGESAPRKHAKGGLPTAAHEPCNHAAGNEAASAPLFSRIERFTESVTLTVDYYVDPTHCLRFRGANLTPEHVQLIHERIAVQAYNDKNLVTTREIIVAPYLDASASITSVPAELVPVTIMLRYMDQPDPSGLQETAVILAVREVMTRSLGWNLCRMDRTPVESVELREVQKLLADDAADEQQQQQQQVGFTDESKQNSAKAELRNRRLSALTTSMSQTVGSDECEETTPYEATRLEFQMLVHCKRTIDITGEVLAQQETNLFAARQLEAAAQHAAKLEYYRTLCTSQTPASQRSRCLQEWLEAINEARLPLSFADSRRRTLLHWVVDWSEDCYAQTRLGEDRLRSQILLLLELGLSPLQCDDRGKTPVQLARDPRSPRPRAAKIFLNVVKKPMCIISGAGPTSATESLLISNTLFESPTGRIYQSAFSATKGSKFFTLELRQLPYLVDGGTRRRTAAVVMLYDLHLKWTFAIHVFKPLSVNVDSGDGCDEAHGGDATMSQWRFYVVPFCQLTHATTESDVLLCSDGTLIAIDYTTPDPKITAVRADGLTMDVFGGEGDGCCCTVQWLSRDECDVRQQMRGEAAARNAAERAALRVARSSYLRQLAQELAELEQISDEEQRRRDTRLRSPDEVFGGLQFAERLLLFPYCDDSAGGERHESFLTGNLHIDVAASDDRAALPLEPTTPASFCEGAEFFNESGRNTSSDGTAGVLCVVAQKRLVVVHLLRQGLHLHATASVAERVRNLANLITSVLSSTAPDNEASSVPLSIQPSFATESSSQPSSAHTNPYHKGHVEVFDLQRFPTGAMSLTSSPISVLLGLPDGKVTEYTIASRQFTIRIAGSPLSAGANNAKSPQLRVLGGRDAPSSITALDVPRRDGKTFDTCCIWAGKSLLVHHIRRDEDDNPSPSLCPPSLNSLRSSSSSCAEDRRDFAIEDLSEDQECTTATLCPKDPDAVYFTRRGSLCRMDLARSEVNVVCPIRISDSELELRAQQRDLHAGVASSGAEFVRFSVDGALVMRFSSLYRTITIYNAQPLVEHARKRSGNGTLICGISPGEDDERSSSSDVTALACVPKERLCGYLQQFSSAAPNISRQVVVDHAFFVLTALLSEQSNFHANVGDRDGRGPASIIARLGTLKEADVDSMMRRWASLLDHGGNIFAVSHTGKTAMEDIIRSRANMESLEAYYHRQCDEVLKEHEDRRMELHQYLLGGATAAPPISPLLSSCQSLPSTRSDGFTKPLRELLGSVPNAKQAALSVCGKRLYAIADSSLVVLSVNALTDAGKKSSSSLVLLPVLPSTTFVVLQIQLPDASHLSDGEHPGAVDVLWLSDGQLIGVSFSPSLGNHPFLSQSIKLSPAIGLMASRDALSINAPSVSCSPIEARVEMLPPLDENSAVFEAHLLPQCIGHMCCVRSGSLLETPPVLVAVPLLLEKERLQGLASANGYIRAGTVLSALEIGCVATDLGRRQIELPAGSQVLNLSSSGPFSVALVRLQNDDCRIVIYSPLFGHSDAAHWKWVSLMTQAGEAWPAPVRPSCGSGAIAPLYDAARRVLHLCVCTGDVLLVSIDMHFLYGAAKAMHGSATLRAVVSMFIQANFTPHGEQVSACWVPSVRYSRLLEGRKGYDAASQGLLLLREGYLCVCDCFGSGSVVVVGSLIYTPDELAALRRDLDAPEESYEHRRDHLPILCGGWNRLLASASSSPPDEWTILRINELHHCVCAVSWDALIVRALRRAPAADEYGHVAGGVAARTLVDFPRASKFCQRPCAPPLRYSKDCPLVTEGLAPPRTSFLRGYLGRLSSASAAVATQLRHLQLVLDAIEAGSAVPWQADADGRTAFHIFASIFRSLDRKQAKDLLNALLSAKCSPFYCDRQLAAPADDEGLHKLLLEVSSEATASSPPASDQPGSIAPDAVLEKVIQIQWSSVTDKIVYAMIADGSVLRVNAESGHRDVLFKLDMNETLTTKGPVAFFCTALEQPSQTRAEEEASATSSLPMPPVRDQMPTDILFFSNKLLALVYDPSDAAVVEVLPGQGVEWRANVASSFLSDPTSPEAISSRKRTPAHDLATGESMDNNNGEDGLRTHGLTGLVPSTQHVGMAAAWYFKAGGHKVGDPLVPVAVLVLSHASHQVRVVRLYPPSGVSVIYPRLIAAMIKIATPQLVVIPRAVGLAQQTEISSTLDLEVLDTAACERPEHVYPLIVHTPKNPFGDSFSVCFERGLRGTLHVYSSPMFLPVAHMSMLADERLLHYNLRRIALVSGEAAEAARQQLHRMNDVLVPLVHGGKNVTWGCGTGIFSAHMEVHGSPAQGSLVYGIKGQSFFSPPEDLTVDVCAAGFHKDTVLLSIHGKLFAFNTQLGTLDLVGLVDHTKIRPQGDNSVSLSRGGSHVGLHNLHSQQLALFGFDQHVHPVLSKRTSAQPHNWVIGFNDNFDASAAGNLLLAESYSAKEASAGALSSSSASTAFLVKEKQLWYIRNLSLMRVVPLLTDQQSERRFFGFSQQAPAQLWQILTLRRVLAIQLRAIQSGSVSAVDVLDADGRTPLHTALLYHSAWLSCYKTHCQATRGAPSTQRISRMYKENKECLTQAVASLLRAGASMYRCDRFGLRPGDLLVGAEPDIQACVESALSKCLSGLSSKPNASFIVSLAPDADGFDARRVVSSESSLLVSSVPCDVVQQFLPPCTGQVSLIVPPRYAKDVEEGIVRPVILELCSDPRQGGGPPPSVAIVNLGTDGLLLTSEGVVACVKEADGGPSRRFMTYKHPSPLSWRTRANDAASSSGGSAVCSISASSALQDETYTITVAVIRQSTGLLTEGLAGQLFVRRWQSSASFVRLSSASALAGYVSSMLEDMWTAHDVQKHNILGSSTPEVKVLGDATVAVLLDGCVKFYQWDRVAAGSVNEFRMGRTTGIEMSRTHDCERLVVSVGGSSGGLVSPRLLGSPAAAVFTSTGAILATVPGKSTLTGTHVRITSNVLVDARGGAVLALYVAEASGGDELYLFSMSTANAAARLTPLSFSGAEEHFSAAAFTFRIALATDTLPGDLVVFCSPVGGGGVSLQGTIPFGVLRRAHGRIEGADGIILNCPL
jgi:hypothetical protein